MERFYKRKAEVVLSTEEQAPSAKKDKVDNEEVKGSDKSINLANLESDPGLRIPIGDYNVNDQDEVRRRYLLQGPCQPKNHIFPFTKCGEKDRRFNSKWFKDHPSWLEYSIEKDAAFCLFCYLCKGNVGEQDCFVSKGYSNWKKRDRFRTHVGKPGSAHNYALKKCNALLNQKQHIATFFTKQSKNDQIQYCICLESLVDSIKFLLRQGLPFRGHDESTDSSNQGNFLELLKFMGCLNKDIKDATLQNAPENGKLASPDIQKDIVNAAAIETINVIIKEIGDSLFSVLVDESRDISMKEQMAIVVRYVDKRGCVIERFLGLEHVPSTTAIALKAAIDKVFSRYKLSITSLRGQGYDGASNMQGKFNRLKALILKENSSAYYIHCFAHQLQLALVGVAKKHPHVTEFFSAVASILNVVGASAKHSDILQEKQIARIAKALENEEIESGRGLNQSTNLKCHGDTCWGSHYGTLLSLLTLYSSTIEVLEIIIDDVLNSEQRFDATNVLVNMHSYSFAFTLHLMRNILGVSSELSKALQRKDQDIANAITLVKICKSRLQDMRDSGWDSFASQVSSFCGNHNIVVPDMNLIFVPRGRSRRNTYKSTNLHHYQVELYYSIIDMQLQELNSRFDEVNTTLLLCVSCLCPDNMFIAFEKEKLIQLAEFYPSDFSLTEIMELNDQLQTYIVDMRSSTEFSELKGIGNLARTMVKVGRDKVYPLIYRLITLSLILPVATATVERVFSGMQFVKTKLRNRMGDQWLNDSLTIFVEREIFASVSNESIMQRFQNMKTRRGNL